MTAYRYEFVIETEDDWVLDPVEIDYVVARAASGIAESFDVPIATCYFERDVAT